MNSLEEIAAHICQVMENLSPSLIPELKSLISTLYVDLTKTTSRFIDLDPSVKHNNPELTEKVFQNLHRLFESVEADNLFLLYETLQSYLFMKVKHGEAADWFLKNELIR